MAIENSKVQTKKREDAEFNQEFIKNMRIDALGEEGISGYGYEYEGSEDKLAKAEAEIRRAQQDAKDKLGSGSGSGSGTKGKTPAQLLAEENRLQQEAYDLKLAYYNLMEQSAPGQYEMAIRQLEADKLRTEAQTQMNEALQKGIITEEQHRAAIAATEEQYKKTMEAASKYVQVIADDFESIFGSLAELTKNFVGEQSEAYRVLFAISKAFSIANAAVAMYDAIMLAYESGPFPWNLGAVAAVTTATAGLLSSIAAVNYSGGYDKGGAIPAGSYGMVGEYGPEFVKGPAQVTGRQDTSKMIGDLIDEIRSGKLGGEGGNVRIINVTEESAEDYLGSDPGEQKVINIIQRNGAVIKQLVA